MKEKDPSSPGVKINKGSLQVSKLSKNVVSGNSIIDDFTLKKAEIDHSEPIILATFLLPYTVEREKKTGQLIIRSCFHNPTMLYATLHHWIQRQQFNFHWVGLITTLEDISEIEKE